MRDCLSLFRIAVMAGSWLSSTWPAYLFLFIFTYIHTTQAAFVEFSNCLSGDRITSNPRLLQFVPLNVTATFLPNRPNHHFNVTVYGNVTGQAYRGTYPPPTDPSWRDPNNTFGKIVNVEQGAALATTLFTSVNVLSYTPYSGPAAYFCANTITPCPLAPSFYVDSTELSQLSAYSVAHTLDSSFAFTTVGVTTKIQSGQINGEFYGCTIAYITPDLGTSLKNLLRYLPMAILVVVGIATVAAAMLSPWGSLDIFYWSSNFGRDEDVLRLVTPGFGDCLQYIQFVVFTGSLTLNYPGYYQPVVSRVGWSSLLFNESLITGGSGTTPVVDGLYSYRPGSTHGLDRMTQLIGMASPRDAWADMMVWLAVIIAAVVVLTQIGFLLRWIYRQVKEVPAEDLRSKNAYFSVGNIVRISFGFFLLPLIALSMFQFVIAGLSPTYTVALAALVLVIVVAYSCWLVYLFITIRPRSFMFDDLQTVLAYGPLYNTYRDDTATFALIPIAVNFLRGIAVGAMQQSGVAQIVLLAICELALILTLNGFRPYPTATSMNMYHTCFACVRLLTLLLSIAFVPSLAATQGSRGWIGYAILLIHACVLVFGFFLNAVQTLIEVVARLAGAGATGGRDAARGGLTKVFGMRQLSRRVARKDANTRTSMASSTQMLDMQGDSKELEMARSRTRSVSASSAMLLSGDRKKRASQISGISGDLDKQTPDGMSTFSRFSQGMTPMQSPQFDEDGHILGIVKTAETRDPYYRPPRRNTMEFNSAASKPRFSQGSRKDEVVANEEAVDDTGESSSTPPKPEREEEHLPELPKSKTDYAVREVDFYYGVRGPALSSGTRKLKTGPADPTGPVSSARGWFKGVLGGKTKEKGKGFEVVRSAKAPSPALLPPDHEIQPQQQRPIEGTYYDAVSVEPTPSSVSQLAASDLQDDLYTRGASRPRPDAVELRTLPTSYTSVSSSAPPRIDTTSNISSPSRSRSDTSRQYTQRLTDADADADARTAPSLPHRDPRRLSSPRAPLDRESLSNLAHRAPLGSERPLSAQSPHRLPFTNASLSHEHRSDTDHRRSLTVSEVSSYMDEPVPYDGAGQVPPLPVERPSSVGFVKSNRASDSIRYSPHEVVGPLTGQSAEIRGPAPVSRLGYAAQTPLAATSNQTNAPRAIIDDGDDDFTPAWNGSSAVPGAGNRRSRFRD